MKLPTVGHCRRIGTHLALWLAAGTIALAAANSDSNAIHWVSVSEAQVKLDDKTPLAWNVYQPEKKNKKDKKDSNLALVLLGHRYLLLDTQSASCLRSFTDRSESAGSEFR